MDHAERSTAPGRAPRLTSLSGRLWPAHPKPLSDELLSSWIVRLARANGLKLQTFCDLAFGKDHQLWNRDIDRLAPAWLLAELAAHTGTGIGQIRKATLRIYEGLLYAHWQPSGQLRWILPLGVYHRKRRLFGMQFCPQCLAEDVEPYFRVHWRVAVLTFCPTHSIVLHDRCPACGSAVAFHRSELGRPSVLDAGPMCLCHLCGFDLRNAPRETVDFGDHDVRRISLDMAAAVTSGGRRDSPTDCGWFAVLHQLCKAMVSTRSTATLEGYVIGVTDGPGTIIPRGRYAFELRPRTERALAIGRAAWLMTSLSDRLHRAWAARAVRYTDLARDCEDAPRWYRDTIRQFNRLAA